VEQGNPVFRTMRPSMLFSLDERIIRSGKPDPLFRTMR